MFDKIEKVVARFEEIERQMADPIVLNDHKKLTELAQERTDLLDLYEAYGEYQRLKRELTEAQDLLQI